MKQVLNLFGKRLGGLMNERGLTFRELEKETGVSKSSLNDYVCGKGDPSLSRVKILADYFNVDITYLIAEDEESQKRGA